MSLGRPMPGSDLPCGDIDPLGITRTPTYDPDTGLVFMVAETADARHTLAGIDLASGAVVLRRPVPPPRGAEVAHQQRAALTVFEGWVYVAYGGLDGDCGDLWVRWWPRRPSGPGRCAASRCRPAGRAGSGPSGGTVDDGRLLYAVGNGESTQSYDHSDSVLSLSPQLDLVDSSARAVGVGQRCGPGSGLDGTGSGR